MKNLSAVLSISLLTLAGSLAVAIAPPIPGKGSAEVSKQKESMAREKKRMQDACAQQRAQTDQAMTALSKNTALKANADFQRRFEQMRASVRDSQDQRTKAVERKLNEAILKVGRTGPLSDKDVSDMRTQLKTLQDQQAASEQKSVAEFSRVVENKMELLSASEQMKANMVKMQHDMMKQIIDLFPKR
mgnify:CR=1 FL=1